jgi:hypothetical protein
MPKIIRAVAFVLAAVAGVLLLVSGIHGPTETYQLIIDNLPQFIQDQQILQIVNFVALILITISLAGGLAVIAGGILILAPSGNRQVANRFRRWHRDSVANNVGDHSNNNRRSSLCLGRV